MHEEPFWRIFVLVWVFPLGTVPKVANVLVCLTCMPLFGGSNHILNSVCNWERGRRACVCWMTVAREVTELYTLWRNDVLNEVANEWKLKWIVWLLLRPKCKGSKVYALAVCVLSSVSKAEWYWSNMWYLASFHRVVWNVKVTILFSNESTIGYKPLYSAMLSVKWELRLTLTKDFCHLKGKREQKKQSCQFN